MTRAGIIRGYHSTACSTAALVSIGTTRPRREPRHHISERFRISKGIVTPSLINSTHN